MEGLVIARRLWSVLRITFFTIRKGLTWKRKLIMDINLMIKRGRLLRKSITNLISHHHHHHHHSRSAAHGSFGIQEYEFSCSNSPNPVFFHVANSKRKHHSYFPCINPPAVIEEQEAEEQEEEGKSTATVALVPKTPEYTFNRMFDASPFSVRVSNYSSEDDEADEGGGKVDHEAEEFIRRFYEQLRAQSRMQLLQCH
ncbi:hypothetical protein HS088_TW20G00393 [Tripterygium wilfordii]|uniref:Avr9/Cf-9 rapidly elicited protein n=1 Tax=Tripterygium wilfordii TaxID=458696 RepID=A0A7J7C7B2_TRIWF|nr:uncharacterized protein LOC119986885 [Tripterygium wilfordii]KAF5730023.1 hypothetical protein HS088_TW20G00393 [Tripterygium wilfordii]